MYFFFANIVLLYMSFCVRPIFMGRFVLVPLLILITAAQLSAQCLELSDSLYRTAEALYTDGQMPVAGKLFMRSADTESACPGGKYENIAGALSNAAVCFEADNDFASADAAYKKLKIVAQSAGDTATLASVYLSLSRYAMSEARFNQATAFADTSLTLYGLSGDRKGQVESVELITDQLLFHGRYDEAIALINPFIFASNTFTEAEKIRFFKKIGSVYKKANIPDSAIKYYSTVLEYEKSSNGDAAGEYAFVLGECCAQLGRDGEALHYFQLSLDIYSQKKNIYGMAVSLSLSGRTLSRLGRHAEGLSKLAQSQHLFAQEGYQEGVSSAMMSMGSVFEAMHQLDSAYIYYTDARNLAISSGDSFLANKILGLISDMYYRSGDYGNAERVFILSLSDFSTQQYADRSVACNGLGVLYQRLGRYEDAFVRFTEAHELAFKSNDFLIMGQGYTCKGDFDRESGNYGDALLSYRNALDAYSRVRSIADVIASHDKIGQVLCQIGQYRDALASLRTAQSMALHIYDKQSAASTYISIAELFDHTSMPDSALLYLSKSVAMYRQIGRRDLQVNAQNLLARQLIKMHRYSESLTCLNENYALFHSITAASAAIPGFNSAAQLTDLYSLICAANLGLGHCPQAFNSRESASASFIGTLYSRLRNCPVSTIDQLQAQLSSERAALVYSVSSNADAYVMYVGSSESVCVKLATERFAKQILADTASRTFALAGIDRLGVRIPPAEIGGAKQLDAAMSLAVVESFISRYLLLVGRQDDASEPERHFSRMLYDYLLKPVELLYSTKQHLAISCDSSFCKLPFETLLAGDSSPIASKYSVRYIPSFSLARYLSARQYGTRELQLADFSVFVPHELGGIAAAKPLNISQQIQMRRIYNHIADKSQMAQLYAKFDCVNTIGVSRSDAGLTQGIGGKRYTDIAEGSLKSLAESGQLDKYKFVHFSAPCVSVAGVPELASILLLPGGGDDGFLTSSEIAGLTLRADLVSLNGIYSSQQSISGGCNDIAMPFCAAGANSVLLSQWPTSEQFAAAFLQSFYRNAELSNNDYAAALFTTRNEFISGTHGFTWSLPYFWASFTLHGAL